MTEKQPPGVEPLFENAPYEYGAIVAAGAVFFTAGACPLDSDGRVIGLNDPVA
jgi:hypothetical protein